MSRYAGFSWSNGIIAAINVLDKVSLLGLQPALCFTNTCSCSQCIRYMSISLYCSRWGWPNTLHERF